MLLPGYDVAKAAHVVAFFALKAGGKINVLKLAKLLYLAEREFMFRHDVPMFYDRLVSMPDGPVTSITLNLINGDARNETFSRFVARRERYDVRPKAGVSFDGLDELSKADLDILNDLWRKFKEYDGFKLRDWTHKKKNIPEWNDPLGSSVEIPHDKVFESLKKKQSAKLAAEVKTVRQLSRSMQR